jgi:putative RNA 2'-phosphotransferase
VNTDRVQTSKFLSLVLRHKPEEAAVTLDRAGWCHVDALLDGLASRGFALSREALKQIVVENDKKRFQFSDDEEYIRASQGHSVCVDLNYQPQVPPVILYHGTATRFLDAIRQQGIVKGARQHVHLSSTLVVARKVGQRHGRPAVIPVAALDMHKAGKVFYFTPNGVWLVEHVPQEFLRFEEITF